MISVQTFNISTDTGGDFVDTGPFCWGAVHQVQFSKTPVGDTGVLDTGADIRLEFVKSGVVIADYGNIGGINLVRAPAIVEYDTGGVAITNSSREIISGGDQIRLTVNQSAGVAGSKTGTVRVWIRKDD